MASILVVDDDQDFRDMLCYRLEQAGHQVQVAASRAQAETLIKQEKPDLAIVDLMLEDIDGGFVLCYHFKKARPQMPVILVTAVKSAAGMEFDTSTDEERSWIKADAMLDKPVRFETLQAEIERLLPAGV